MSHRKRQAPPSPEHQELVHPLPVFDMGKPLVNLADREALFVVMEEGEVMQDGARMQQVPPPLNSDPR